MDCSVTENCMREWNRMCNENKWCYDCQLDGQCSARMRKEPEKYIKIIQKWSDEHPLEIDWSKVPIDTPVLVRNTDEENWRKRYFCTFLPMSKNPYVTFEYGKSSENSDTIIQWKYCKLDNTEIDYTKFLEE